VRTAAVYRLLLCLAVGISGFNLLSAQEANSGLDLRATLTGQMAASNELTEEPRSGSPVVAGFRSVVYPTIKFNENWFVTGAVQFATRPYYFEEFSTTGYGAKGTLLQATLNYSRVSEKSSVLVRAGQMSTAFGSFMLRYDDADNPLVDLPISYGYYYAPVSITGVAGAQIDATFRKWDGRVQFANSSPANPRSIFAHDQYGNWTAGAGYTIRQGLRVGVSGYRGPYLDRNYPYYFPGEAKPSELNAYATGIDVNWAHRHTSVLGELQQFEMPYKAIPTFRESAGYGEIKQVLSPRWFVAARYGETRSNAAGNDRRIETAAGFRLFRSELIKAGYEATHYSLGTEHYENTFAIQFITTLHTSLSRD
jgi:hypothetical protein